ncbi:MAG: hypothetical protein H6737_16450 [Alphaproteobacteria bacterium]|nr:hypothetical protein [Alphaproteobacteria bacterium]
MAPRAHVGDLIDTLDALQTPDGHAIEATYGLIVEHDGLRWVCHEAVTAPGALLSPDYEVGPDGTWIARMTDLTLARDGHPLWVSTDLCTWAPIPGFEGRIVADVAFGPDGSVWVATADPTGENAVYHGPDASSLEPVLTVTGSRFLSVAVGASVWATSSEGDTALALWHSPDGASFTSSAIPVDPALLAPVDAFVEVAHPTEDTAWVVLDPIGEDRLLEASGGALTEIWAAPDRITDLERADDGTLYATLGDRHPWRVTGTPTLLAGLADASGLAATDHLVLANRSFVNGLLLTVSTDGETPASTALPADIVGPLACPAGTDQATLCEPLWPQLEVRLRPPVDTGDTGMPADTDVPITEPEPEPRCGCAASSPAVPLLPLMRRR